MSLFTWITGKIRPTQAEESQDPSRTEVLGSSGEAADSTTALAAPETGPSPWSSSVPVQNESPAEDDATKTTVSFAPPASGSQSLSATIINTNISRRKSRVPNIDLVLAGEYSRSSPPARNSKLRPLTPYPTTTTTTPVYGGSVSRDEFNEYKKHMESQLLVANARTQEAYKALWEQEQWYESEKLNWQQKSVPRKKSSSPRPSASPSEQRESIGRVDTRDDENLGASQVGGFPVSSRVNLPFKLRKLSAELVLGRAEVCMILREWDEMERRSQEAWAMASDLHYTPLIARCQFFVGIALYGQKKWALASDAFEFAKPCVGVYITNRELNAWRKKVDTAMSASPVGSIESMSSSPSRKRTRRGYSKGWEDLGNISSTGSTLGTPVALPFERVSIIGRENTGDFSSGGTTPEITANLISSPEESPRPRKISVLPRTRPSTSIPIRGDWGSSSSNSDTSAITPRDFPANSDSDRSVHRPPSFQSLRQSERPVDAYGREMVRVSLGRDTPPRPMTRGPSLALVIPKDNVPVRPRRFRLYTPGNDYIYPRTPLRQGPQLRIIPPIKTFPGPGPIPPLPPRPSRIYMPDKPGVVLYPQKPFRQGNRLQVIIPSPEPQPLLLESEGSGSSASFHPLGHHIIPSHSPVLPPRTPPPFSDSNSTGSFPSQPRKPQPPNRTQGLQIMNRDSPKPDAYPKPNKKHVSFSTSSPEEPPWHQRRSPQSSLPRRSQGLRITERVPGSSTTSESGRFFPLTFNPGKSHGSSFDKERQENLPHVHSPVLPDRIQSLWVDSNNGSIYEGSPDELSRYIHELSKLVQTQPRQVVNHPSVTPDRISQAPDSSPEELSRYPAIPDRAGGLRIVNGTPSTAGNSSDEPPRSTPDDSYEEPSRLPHRPPSSKSSSDKPSQPPSRTGGLRIANGTPSTAGNSSDEPPRPPHRTPSSKSSSDKPSQPPSRTGGLRVVNGTPSTAGNSSDEPPRSTPDDSYEEPPRLPHRPPSSKSSCDKPSQPPSRTGGLRVVNGTPSTAGNSSDEPPRSTPDDSYEEPPRPPHRTPSSKSSSDKPSQPPSRSQGLGVVNQTPKPDSSPNKPSSQRALDLDSPGPRSTGEAEWFSDTDSGRPRFVDSPDSYPDGLFDRTILESMDAEHLNGLAEAEIEAGIEIGPFVPQEGSTRQDIRQMVWRPPSRDSTQPQGGTLEEMSDSSDEAENMAFVRSLGLGNAVPTTTLRQGLRVSGRNRKGTADNQLLHDEGRVAHSDKDRIRSGDLGREEETEEERGEEEEHEEEKARQSTGGEENPELVRLLGLGITTPITTLRRGLRVSERSRSGTPEHDQLFDDYIQEWGDEGRVAHSGIERLRRSRSEDLGSTRSGDLGGSGSDWRREYGRTRTRSLDSFLLFDAELEGFAREEEEHVDEARLGSGDDGPDRTPRSRSQEESENPSGRVDESRSESSNHGSGDGGEKIGKGGLDLTLYD